MTPIKTSITLLKAIANDTTTARWSEFFYKYEPMMRSYLSSHYSALDHDDIIQETMRSLVKALPNYHYTPDENGHFKSYLIGIVRHKALDQIRDQKRETEIAQLAADDPTVATVKNNNYEENDRKERILKVAIDQLLADPSINQRNREIFRHVALLHESPEDVASRFGITRGNVDVIKNRLVGKLTSIVSTMEESDSGNASCL